jgi:hypothetical protein
MARSSGRSTRRRKAPAPLTRKQQSRLAREMRLQRIVIGAAIVVAAAVVGVLAYGLISEYVIEARSPVAMVGDTQIRTDAFQSRVRLLRANMAQQLEQWRQQRTEIDPTGVGADLVLDYIDQNITQLEATLAEANKTLIGSQGLNQLARFEIVRQETTRLGIGVQSDEVQQKIELDFGYDRFTETPPLSEAEAITETSEAEVLPPPVTEEEFRERYDSFVKDVLRPLGISEKLYRSWAEAELLEQRLREERSGDVPEDAEQITFRVIVLADAARADELAERLDAGEDFQALVDEIEADEEATDFVRDFDWLPLEQVEQSVGATVTGQLWEMAVGAASGPIPGEDGLSIYLAEMLGHEVRALDEELIDTVADARFEEWMASQQDALVEIGTYEDRIPSNP